MLIEHGPSRSPLILRALGKLRHHHKTHCSPLRVKIASKKLTLNRVGAGPVKYRRRSMPFKLHRLNQI